MLTSYWIESTLNSFAQVFFSKNKFLAVLLILVCFLSPMGGLMSLIFVCGINALATLIGLNKEWINDGVYGFNAVLLATSLTQLYDMNFVFAIVCFASIILLLINTVWLIVILGKYNIPMVSFPFLITFWIVSLGIRSLPDLEINESSLFLINKTAKDATSIMYQLQHFLDFLKLPKAVEVYFKTLGAVFYQPYVIAGVLISIGLLYFSRIAFTLSVMGLLLAYFFYGLMGANVNDLNENLAGANFVFMAIGLGCFYVIPNKWTYLMVLVLVPVLLMMYLFFGKILLIFQLKAFTLSFSVCVALTLFLLNHRVLHQWVHLVGIQYYSAEKTIYKYVSSLNRFKNQHFFKFQLPFWGEWKVSQGYDGDITHLGEWKNALDFVIVNQEDETYKLPGSSVDDFYCYNKPVLAPADGYVYAIENNIEENKIGGVDVENNWGNTIIINHLNGLYTQISHLKKDSFKVAVGDFVSKGAILAACGNSGRSPEPHIHFQVQLNPTIGWSTHAYPIAYFIEKSNEKLNLRYFEVPKENSLIQGVKPDIALVNAFQLWPGKKLELSTPESKITWEVMTDAWNNSYLHCSLTNSFAYFINDGSMFYFFDFEGDKKSLLFEFYLACHRVLLGVYQNLAITDQVPLHYFNNKIIKFFQDFAAPFYLFTDIHYNSSFIAIDDPNSPSEFILNSTIERKFFSKKKIVKEYLVTFKEKRLLSFSVKESGNYLKTYQCELV